jgi:hypothetical protein
MTTLCTVTEEQYLKEMEVYLHQYQ